MVLNFVTQHLIYSGDNETVRWVWTIIRKGLGAKRNLINEENVPL